MFCKNKYKSVKKLIIMLKNIWLKLNKYIII